MSEKKRFLITGSPKLESLIFLLRNVFSIKEPSNDFNKDYETDKFIITIACDLERANFNFKSFQTRCNNIRRNLRAIITIENLNPRPETLNNSMKKLGEIFSSSELEKSLYVIFTSNDNIDETYIRESFLQFNVVFDILGISNEINKNKFAKDRVHLLEKINLEKLNSKTVSIITQPKQKCSCIII